MESRRGPGPRKGGRPVCSRLTSSPVEHDKRGENQTVLAQLSPTLRHGESEIVLLGEIRGNEL